MRRGVRALTLLLAGGLAGCSALLSYGDVVFEDGDGGMDGGVAMDAGGRDGGGSDGGGSDGGGTDGGGSDGGGTDGGGTDGGGSDAGAPDAAGFDAGAPRSCPGTDPGVGTLFPRYIMPTPVGSGLPNQQAYVALTDVVVDAVTGLEWERNPSSTAMNRADARTYCAGLSSGGCSDWRLPEMHELVSITDVTQRNPAINGGVFPGTASAPYWSNTDAAAMTGTGWIVAFAAGDANVDDVLRQHRVRCVRRPGAHPGDMRTLAGGVMVDGRTGLSWPSAPEMSMSNHAAALAFCDTLSFGGFSDWRLPRRNELTTIVDTTQASPAVDPARFSVLTGQNFFWTADVDVTSSNPWFLAFTEEGRHFADPITSASIRCVRP